MTLSFDLLLTVKLESGKSLLSDFNCSRLKFEAITVNMCVPNVHVSFKT